MIWPAQELPFVAPIIHEVRQPPFVSVVLDSLRTNAKTFKTPVKFCIYCETRGYFILTLEGIFRVYLFDERAAAVNELAPANAEKNALNIVALDFSDKQSKVISSASCPRH